MYPYQPDRRSARSMDPYRPDRGSRIEDRPDRCTNVSQIGVRPDRCTHLRSDRPVPDQCAHRRSERPNPLRRTVAEQSPNNLGMLPNSRRTSPNIAEHLPNSRRTPPNISEHLADSRQPLTPPFPSVRAAAIGKCFTTTVPCTRGLRTATHHLAPLLTIVHTAFGSRLLQGRDHIFSSACPLRLRAAVQLPLALQFRLRPPTCCAWRRCYA
jgi:hypothetical protein